MIKYVIILALAFCAIAVVRFVIRIAKKRSEKKELLLHASDKLREEELDRHILNPDAGTADGASPATPFRVSYEDGKPGRTGKRKHGKSTAGGIMLQITEKNGLSERKYMFDPKRGIRIGSRTGENDIVVNDPGVDAFQCHIAGKEKNAYIKNDGRSGAVVIVRAGDRAFVGNRMIELKSGDVILLGGTSLRLDIVTV